MVVEIANVALSWNEIVIHLWMYEYNNFKL